MNRKLIKKNESKISVLQIIGFILIILPILYIIGKYIYNLTNHQSALGLTPEEIAVLFFIIMLGFAFAFPDLLQDQNCGLSTMRIIVFMMTNVICMLLLKIGWDKPDFGAIKINEYWMGIIAFIFGAKATQSFFEAWANRNNSSQRADNDINTFKDSSVAQLSDEQLVKLAITQNEDHLKIIFPNIQFLNDTIAIVNGKRKDVLGIYLKDKNDSGIPANISVNYNNKRYTVDTKVFPNVSMAKTSGGMDGSIANERSRLYTGSACCVCQNSDGEQFILTNCHVLTEGDLDDPLDDTDNDKVYYNNDVIGTWSFGIMDKSGDFAMVLLKDGDEFISNNNVEQFNNQLKPVTKDDYLTPVTVRGNKSNQTGFIIDKAKKKIGIQYNHGQTIIFNEAILLGNTPDGTICSPVSDFGDSGGAVFNDKMELIGIITGTIDGRFTVVISLNDFANIHSLQII